MTAASVTRRPTSGPVEIAIAELRRQLEHSRELVQSAELALRSACNGNALALLSQAREELGDVRHITRVERGLVTALQLLEGGRA